MKEYKTWIIKRGAVTYWEVISSLILWQQGPTRELKRKNIVFACCAKMIFAFSFGSYIPLTYISKCTWSTCWTRLGCTCNDSCPRKTARKSWGPTWKRLQSLNPHGTSCVVCIYWITFVCNHRQWSGQNTVRWELGKWWMDGVML